MVVQQRAESYNVKLSEKTFKMDVSLENHGQSCISVSLWPWDSGDV